MSQIGCTSKDKARFDELKPDELTQKEFFEIVLDAYENQDEKVIIDTDEIVNGITKQTATEIELAARRGTIHALQDATND